jgi:hypothetical protein
MYLSKILTPLVACALLATPTAPVWAQPKGDQVLLDMQQAFRKGDRKRLEQLFPQAKGHALEPWAAYWELKARLNDASAQEVQGFLQRWAGTTRKTACATTGCCCWASAATGRSLPSTTPSTACRTTARCAATRC